ncbi:MAG TPA: aldehyde dehydrogenase family protein [Thermoleophilaceae bacterium]|jgi:1-pyrroline-5-carboxylate dehydrogenase
MSTRLTYTSGALGAETEEEFEARLATARDANPEPLPHLIGGEERDGGETFERVDPCSDDSVASRAREGGGEVVAEAVEAARRDAAAWRATPYPERCELMRAVADGIGERHIELAAVVSLETGKTRTESILEVQEAVDLITSYARLMEENDGFTRPLDSFVEGERNTDVLRPYGVFAVISPFNFPVALTINMSAAALIAGNTVVLKPSEDTPWSGGILAEIARATDLPAGVFNLVHGGPATGRALAQAEVDGVAFTGSAEVGREIARRLQEGAFARPALTEMGGKNPAIVSDRADLEKAVEGVAKSAYGLSGQKCSACSRAIVVGSVHDEFVERLAEYAAGLALGDPSDRDAFLGPVVNEASVARYEAAVADARRDGSVDAGGGRPDRPGLFVEPTVVSGLPAGHRLERDELFVPFVAVTRVDSLDEAIAEANAPVYGLTAGIFTENEGEKERFLDTIQAGVVYVNRRAGATTGAWPGTQTFCGWKSSGSTGKGGLGPWYLPQFMREQSRTIVG